MKRTVLIKGKVLDFDKLEDATVLQNAVTPTNWSGTKKDAARVFLLTHKMLTEEFQKHLAHNWKKYAHAAQQQKDDGEEAVTGGSFSFTLNFSAPTVAAIGSTKMGGSQKFSSEGKARTQDINQAELFKDGEEETTTFDPGALDEENAAAAKEAADALAAEEKAKQKAAKADKKAKGKKTKIEKFPEPAKE